MALIIPYWLELSKTEGKGTSVIKARAKQANDNRQKRECVFTLKDSHNNTQSIKVSQEGNADYDENLVIDIDKDVIYIDAAKGSTASFQLTIPTANDTDKNHWYNTTLWNASSRYNFIYSDVVENDKGGFTCTIIVIAKEDNDTNDNITEVDSFYWNDTNQGYDAITIVQRPANYVDTTDYICVTPSVTSISASGGTISVEVTSSNPWTVTADSNITISEKTPTSCKIIVEANTSGSKLSNYVTFSNGSKSAVLTINQNVGSASTTGVIISNVSNITDGKFTFDVETEEDDTAWSIVNRNSNVSLSAVKGVGNTTVTGTLTKVSDADFSTLKSSSFLTTASLDNVTVNPVVTDTVLDTVVVENSNSKVTSTATITKLASDTELKDITDITSDRLALIFGNDVYDNYYKFIYSIPVKEGDEISFKQPERYEVYIYQDENSLYNRYDESFTSTETGNLAIIFYIKEENTSDYILQETFTILVGDKEYIIDLYQYPRSYNYFTVGRGYRSSEDDCFNFPIICISEWQAYKKYSYNPDPTFTPTNGNKGLTWIKLPVDRQAIVYDNLSDPKKYTYDRGNGYSLIANTLDQNDNSYNGRNKTGFGYVYDVRYVDNIDTQYLFYVNNKQVNYITIDGNSQQINVEVKLPSKELIITEVTKSDNIVKVEDDKSENDRYIANSDGSYTYKFPTYRIKEYKGYSIPRLFEFRVYNRNEESQSNLTIIQEPIDGDLAINEDTITLNSTVDDSTTIVKSLEYVEDSNTYASDSRTLVYDAYGCQNAKAGSHVTTKTILFGDYYEASDITITYPASRFIVDLYKYTGTKYGAIKLSILKDNTTDYILQDDINIYIASANRTITITVYQLPERYNLVKVYNPIRVSDSKVEFPVVSYYKFNANTSTSLNSATTVFEAGLHFIKATYQDSFPKFHTCIYDLGTTSTSEVEAGKYPALLCNTQALNYPWSKGNYKLDTDAIEFYSNGTKITDGRLYVDAEAGSTFDIEIRSTSLSLVNAAFETFYNSYELSSYKFWDITLNETGKEVSKTNTYYSWHIKGKMTKTNDLGVPRLVDVIVTADSEEAEYPYRSTLHIIQNNTSEARNEAIDNNSHFIENDGNEDYEVDESTIPSWAKVTKVSNGLVVSLIKNNNTTAINKANVTLTSSTGETKTISLQQARRYNYIEDVAYFTNGDATKIISDRRGYFIPGTSLKTTGVTHLQYHGNGKVKLKISTSTEYLPEGVSSEYHAIIIAAAENVISSGTLYPYEVPLISSDSITANIYDGAIKIYDPTIEDKTERKKSNIYNKEFDGGDEIYALDIFININATRYSKYYFWIEAINPDTDEVKCRMLFKAIAFTPSEVDGMQ